MKKILSYLLIAALVIQSMGLSVFAAGTEDTQKSAEKHTAYKNVVILGDSICLGFEVARSLKDGGSNSFDIEDNILISGKGRYQHSYPTQFAKRIGLDPFADIEDGETWNYLNETDWDDVYNFGICAAWSSDIYKLLTDEYYKYDYAGGNYDEDDMFELTYGADYTQYDDYGMPKEELGHIDAGEVIPTAIYYDGYGLYLNPVISEGFIDENQVRRSYEYLSRNALDKGEIVYYPSKYYWDSTYGYGYYAADESDENIAKYGKAVSNPAFTKYYYNLANKTVEEGDLIMLALGNNDIYHTFMAYQQAPEAGALGSIIAILSMALMNGYSVSEIFEVLTNLDYYRNLDWTDPYLDWTDSKLMIAMMLLSFFPATEMANDGDEVILSNDECSFSVELTDEGQIDMDLGDALDDNSIETLLKHYSSENITAALADVIADYKVNYENIVKYIGDKKEAAGKEYEIALISHYNPFGLANYMTLITEAMESGELQERLTGDGAVIIRLMQAIFGTTSFWEMIMNMGEGDLEEIISKSRENIDYDALIEILTSTSSTGEKSLDRAFNTVTYPLSVAVLGSGLQETYGIMNTYLQDLNDKYKNTYSISYTDISSAPCSGDYDPHPRAQGDEWIADTIYEALVNEVSASVVCNDGAEGTINYEGTSTVAHDRSICYEFKAERGSEISAVYVDGKLLSEKNHPEVYRDGKYEFKNVNENHSIRVDFSLSDEVFYNVVINGSESDAAGNGEYLPGETVTVKAGEKEGYSFNKWTGDGVAFANANAAQTTFVMPEKDVEINADWSINSYTISFDTKGGNTVDSITQEYGTTVKEPASPEKEGYTFKGWKNLPSKMPAENVTATAEWKINQYTISFDTDGGNTIDPITQDYGTAITAPANPTKSGYTFKGWSETIPSTMPAEDKTITALWTQNGSGGGGSTGGGGGGGGAVQTAKFSLTFETNGGSAISDVTMEKGTKVDLSKYTTAKSGYVFDGWYSDKNLTKAESNVTLDKNVTVYAKWKEAKFSKNGTYKGYIDVDESLWYGTQQQGVVRDVTLLGIMNGDSDGKFRPVDDIKLSEVIKMAAVVHNIYYGSKYTFNAVQGADWYKEYVKYAVDNGIIAEGEFTDFTRAATRAEMAYIFAKAVPEEYLPAITAKMAPDVNSGDKYFAEIQKLYKAGVLIGNDEKGTFSGNTNIKRVEAAAIITRIALPETRIA